VHREPGGGNYGANPGQDIISAQWTITDPGDGKVLHTLQDTWRVSCQSGSHIPLRTLIDAFVIPA
jgi:hypothetical protein